MDKLFEKMKNNPRGDWRIEDVIKVCKLCGLTVEKPTNGSHYNIKGFAHGKLLTIPYNRPIKFVYIKRLIAYIKANGENDG
jgi:hypothetical protein